MQILFYTTMAAQEYAEGRGYYPEAPARCPHPGCHCPVKMLKHGFYKRYIILLSYEGFIWIRRYICSKCGRTVSMLPSFCIPRHQYGLEVIIGALQEATQRGSIKYAGTKWKKRPPSLARRHIIHYRNRVIQNRGCIQLGLNMMSPGFIGLTQIAGDTDWTRRFLDAATDPNLPQFNVTYHELTGKSFMSLHNNVA